MKFNPLILNLNKRYQKVVEPKVTASNYDDLEKEVNFSTVQEIPIVKIIFASKDFLLMSIWTTVLADNTNHPVKQA